MAVENALRKARAVRRRGVAEAVLGCDTIVVLDGVIYGKPPDAAVARATLTALGGRTHEVLSGVALLLTDARSGVSSARPWRARSVTFRAIDGELLDWYVATGEWRGRSGGYAIQGAGATLALRAGRRRGERRRAAAGHAPRALPRAAAVATKAIRI